MKGLFVGPARRVLIAGAGNGEVPKAFAVAFTRTIAIEPNIYLRNQLQQTLPTAEAIGLPILAAQPAAQGDLVPAPTRSITFLRRTGWRTWNASSREWRQPA